MSGWLPHPDRGTTPMMARVREEYPIVEGGDVGEHGQGANATAGLPSRLPWFCSAPLRNITPRDDVARHEGGHFAVSEGASDTQAVTVNVDHE